MTVTKPDLIRTIQGEGVELKQKGRHWRALCPLHSEKTPSFTVDSEKGLWYCFGCGKGGDQIAFIRELRGLSFKETLDYLHLEKSRPLVSPEVLEKKQAVKSFRTWCKDRENEYCMELQTLNRIALSIKNFEDLGRFAPIFPEITVLNYYLDILQGNDDELKFNLFMELGNGRL